MRLRRIFAEREWGTNSYAGSARVGAMRACDHYMEDVIEVPAGVPVLRSNCFDSEEIVVVGV
mgnify:CR=1 FL=1|jgi:hypothetical protein